MCGIVGVVGKELSYEAATAFSDLLQIDTLRGSDSTGVLTVEEGEVNVLKRAINGFNLTDLKQFSTMLPYKSYSYGNYGNSWNSGYGREDYRLFLGHNRAATIGKVNDATAHPFNQGSTYLVHNGTLRSWDKLFNSNIALSDSEAICFNIEQEGILTTVEKLIGAFTLGYYNELTQVFSLIRNEERPMWLGFLEKEDVTFFASEPGFMVAALERRGFILDRLVELPVGELWSFDLAAKDNVSEPVVTKDVKLYKPIALPPAKKDKKKANSSKVVSISKKDETTANFLKAYGLKSGDTVHVQLNAFSRYEQGNINKEVVGKASGVVVDSRVTEDLEGIAFLCKEEDYELAMLEGGLVKAEVSGAAYKNSKPYAMTMKVSNVLSEEESLTFWNNMCTVYELEEKEEEEEADDIGNRFPEDLKERIKDGCCFCADPISDAESGSLLWIDDYHPICPSCSSNVAGEAHRAQLTVSEYLSTLNY